MDLGSLRLESLLPYLLAISRSLTLNEYVNNQTSTQFTDLWPPMERAGPLVSTNQGFYASTNAGFVRATHGVVNTLPRASPYLSKL